MVRLPRLVVPDPRNTKSIESDPIDLHLITAEQKCYRLGENND
jgi:hypothetical protein